jgi:hypothetical protein
MNLAIFVLQLIQDDTLQLTKDDNYGDALILMLAILVLAAAFITWGLWWGRPRRHRSHHW